MISGADLAKLSVEELIELHSTLPEPTAEQKEKALAKMDTGIYDAGGNLVGDSFEDEDAYVDEDVIVY